MKRRTDTSGFAWLFSPSAWLWLWVPVLAISAAHYTTGAAHHWLHDIFRRLYYIPIVLGAFRFGLKGALGASVAASLFYAPHAFTHLFVHDPGNPIEKALEILLYNVVALITGTLADREHKERLRQEDTARQLSATLDEMKAMERQLIRSGRLQSLGQLTMGLAHEIKNPLASLKGSAEILGDEIAPDSPRRRMLEIHQQELDRLAGLLERFLSFARPRPVDARELSLCEVIERTTALIEPQAASLGIAVRWERGDADVRTRGDADMLVQVLVNLALNAAQASPEGSAVTMRCGCVERGRRRYATVSVDDAGPGVPEENREKVFDPFFTTREGGTGLGLSIAARIVDEHEGFMEVSRSEHGGASFRVLLPGVR